MSFDPTTPTWVRWSLGVLLLWVLAVGIWNGGLEPGDGRRHFYDERYNFQNVRGLLFGDPPRPLNGYYSPASYLPQTALLGVTHLAHRTLDLQALAIRDGRSFTPLAYRMARGFSTLYAVLAVWLLFRLGSVLFDPVTGLVAAFLLAVMPLHMHHSGFFKPDSLLVFACVLALWAVYRAVEKPALRSYLVAGAAVGLAAAAKPNGSITAIPLVLASLPWLSGRRRTLLWLLAAGALALVVLALANPFPAIALRDLDHNLRIYEWKAQRDGAPQGGPLAQEAALLTSANYHGPIVGILALVGLALLLAVVFRRRTDPAIRRRLLIPLGFFLGYSLFIAAATPFARYTIFLPVAPVTSLAAAWLMTTAEKRAGRRWSASRPFFALLLAVLLLAVGVLGHRHLYRWYVPTTWEKASKLVAQSLGSPSYRIVCTDDTGEELRVVRDGKRSALLRLARKAPHDRVDPRELALCDVSVLPLEEAFEHGPVSGEARGKRARRLLRRGRRIEIEPGWSWARGPALEVGLHPWRAAGAPETVELRRGSEGPGVWVGELQAPTGSPVTRSLALRLPPEAKLGAPPAIALDGEPLTLLWMDKLQRDKWYLTPRRREMPVGARVELRLDGLGEETVPELLALGWLPPRKGEGLRRR